MPNNIDSKPTTEPLITQPSQDVSAELEQEVAEEPRIKGRIVNGILCVLAFCILLGYLFIAGEGPQIVNALANMHWGWLGLGILMVVLYWFFESACMQVFSHDTCPGFKFRHTLICTVIGQYFNCITPLSSGGQPFQAYYYSRFGMSLSKSMPMLLCRFVTYQIATTTFCALVLILRLSYFTEQYPRLIVLVVIGFIGGLGLLAILLAIAFWRNGIVKIVTVCIKLLAKIHLVKDPDASIVGIVKTIDDAYKEVHYLLKKPALFAKSIGITFVQLLEYFAISYVIMRGLGGDADPLSVISCQAFVYMISSFVPTPGAMGAAEASYATFFTSVYANMSLVALSTFIWRFLTFYFPIVAGMVVTLVINRKQGKRKLQ